LFLIAAGAGGGLASAQNAASELTLFSNPGVGGAQFTVTGPRTKLALPFVPRSAAIAGGGSWQICSQADYQGKCLVIGATMNALDFGAVGSARPLDATKPAPPPPSATAWKEVVRLDVRDGADRDLAASRDTKTMFREVQVCSERSTVRIRRAEVQLRNKQWQRLFVPLVLEEGKCSNAIDLLGGPTRIRAVRFEYEAWTPGLARGTISVKALPNVTVTPR
jgi:hypothetical protein